MTQRSERSRKARKCGRERAMKADAMRESESRGTIRKGERGGAEGTLSLFARCQQSSRTVGLSYGCLSSGGACCQSGHLAPLSLTHPSCAGAELRDG